MNWEEIDNIERVTPRHNWKRKENPPSVDKIIGDFDKLACDENPTEEDFHQNTQKTKVEGKLVYIQKALAQTLRWQSFCKTTT